MKREVKNILDELLSNGDLLPEDIPSLDLYMDQIITLFDSKFGNVDSDEKVITKTMINNYSKAKMINPIKGKTYSKERIMQILMIYIMKNSLTMQQMKTVMQKMYEVEQIGEDGFVRAYRKYLAFKENEKEVFPALIDELLPSIDNDVGLEDVFVTLLCVCAMSEQLNSLADQLVIKHFNVSTEK